MQRAAESDQHQPRSAHTGRRTWRRTERRSGRLGRVVVGAAVVPMMLLAVGCSSDSDSDSSSGDDLPAGATAEPGETTALPEVAEAAYAKLPDACEVFAQKTLTSLVPKGTKSGKAINEPEADVTGDCRWTSLDDNGVKGSQYRWLSVSLHLLASDATNGAGEDRAHDAFEDKVAAAEATDGAKSVKTEPVTGLGDEATAVRYELKKKDDTFKQQTIVVRTENVVVTLDYNGAGLAGEKAPDAAGLLKSAKSAAKEVVAAVAEANEEDGGKASPSPTKSTSRTPSKGATKAASSGGSGSDLSSGSDDDSDSSSSSGSSSSRKKTSR